MLSQEIKEKIFCNENCDNIPFGWQSRMVHVFEDVLEEIRKEKPYATVSELLSTDATTDV